MQVCYLKCGFCSLGGCKCVNGLIYPEIQRIFCLDGNLGYFYIEDGNISYLAQMKLETSVMQSSHSNYSMLLKIVEMLKQGLIIHLVC